jgi:hypothetical protein
MASPFENLIQAAQFGVQTRMGYDQMVEKRRENTQNLLQRRAEQEQQNQQFLAEMNVKDRQLKMQSEQFNQNMGLERQKLQQQDKQFSQELGFRKESFGKEFGLKKESFEFEKAFKNKQQAFDFRQGAFSQPWYALEYAKIRDRDPVTGRTLEKEPKGPFVKVNTGSDEFYKKQGRVSPSFGERTRSGLVTEAVAGGGVPGLGGFITGFANAGQGKTVVTNKKSLIDYTKQQISALDVATQQAYDKKGRVDPISAADALTRAVGALETNKEMLSETEYNNLMRTLMNRDMFLGTEIIPKYFSQQQPPPQE